MRESKQLRLGTKIRLRSVPEHLTTPNPLLEVRHTMKVGAIFLALAALTEHGETWPSRPTLVSTSTSYHTHT